MAEHPAVLGVVLRAGRELIRDKGTDIAAAMTYWAVLALFPGLIAIVSLLSLVVQSSQVTDSLLETFSELIPPTTWAVLEEPLTALTRFPSAGLGLALGLAGALWTASGYVAAFSRGMNRIYRVEEGRPFWKLRGVLLLVTALSIALLVLMAILFVLTGPVARWVGDLVGFGDTAVLVWDVLKWPVVVLFAMALIALLFTATPNIRIRFRLITIGSMVAVLVWAATTTGFFFYVANFSNYNATYGSLGGVIVFLLWIYLTNLVFLFGAELDAEVRRVRQLRRGLDAEYGLELRLRDTSEIDRGREALARDVLASKAWKRDHDDPRA